ncbi:GDYXXLXY domain-containing protein [Sandaracinobacter sp. RS1-74]|uniref:GDYXXLXY domain-containing protein n=1 Tax=Sandaracinobacteroides sayramensis TaxID=2913411 RepID=UPI001EDC343D|nr:GDYXXLXY domain-containing protein [Sandaracinobacteroides sayramensis]MCG2840593.1 GDYXXLXY domain-containing protein [Sandaracinobacteroides sayramensis]
MKKALLAAALALPFLVLGHGIWRHQSNLSSADEWHIPIRGYDPRDPLRGHYIRFAYDWELRGNGRACVDALDCNLCLGREDGRVIATVETPGMECSARVSPRASDMQISASFPAGTAAFSSRLFVSESSAPILEAQLREGPMQVVAALGPDGRLVNRRIVPVSGGR